MTIQEIQKIYNFYVARKRLLVTNCKIKSDHFDEIKAKHRFPFKKV